MVIQRAVEGIQLLSACCGKRGGYRHILATAAELFCIGDRSRPDKRLLSPMTFRGKEQGNSMQEFSLAIGVVRRDALYYGRFSDVLHPVAPPESGRRITRAETQLRKSFTPGRS